MKFNHGTLLFTNVSPTSILLLLFFQSFYFMLVLTLAVKLVNVRKNYYFKEQI